MAKENLRKQYRDLETKTHSRLRDKINKSKVQSKTVDSKAIQVDINGYKELAIINDKLTFIDGNGYQYDIYTVSLEDLIDLEDWINTLKQ